MIYAPARSLRHSVKVSRRFTSSLCLLIMKLRYSLYTCISDNTSMLRRVQRRQWLNSTTASTRQGQLYVKSSLCRVWCNHKLDDDIVLSHEDVRCQVWSPYMSFSMHATTDKPSITRESHTFGVFDCALPLKKSGTDLRSMS